MKKENNEYYKAIIELLTILENNYRYKYGKKIPYEDVFEMVKDLTNLFNSL